MHSDAGAVIRGAAPALTESQGLAVARIEADVEHLAGTIGERHVLAPEGLAAAATWIESRLSAAGWSTQRQSLATGAETVCNVIGERRGAVHPEEIVIIGAHYDSLIGTVGADDNASGTVAVVALAERLRSMRPDRTLRFVGFVNEEPPWYDTPDMGAERYAAACAERGDQVVAMLSLESIGYFDDTPGAQRYPKPFSMMYPDRGNFVAFVGNLGSRGLVHRSIRTFREHATVPSEGIAAPGWIEGLSFSDHRAFWARGVPAIMVTGTAMFRNPHYHTPRDEPDVVDAERLWRVVDGLEPVVRALVAVDG